MSLLFRFATAAVIRENERLRHDITVWRDRALSAERHRELANTQISNQRRVITEQAEAINKLREENTVAAVDACPTAQTVADHDQDKAGSNT